MNKENKVHWNHRVIRFEPILSNGKPGTPYLAICEVYYTNGEPDSFAGPMNIVGEVISDLTWTLEKMLECCNKPILNEDLTEWTET